MFHIDYDCQWYHDGDAIQRKTLKKLLSEKSLTVDNQGHYWMSGPFEKYPVSVEDVPYVIVDYRIRNAGKEDQAILLLTDMDEKVILSPEKKLFLRPESRRGQSVPYVDVRYGLTARVGRAVLVELMEKALSLPHDSRADILTIRSHGFDHPLGSMAEDDKAVAQR